MAEILLRLSTIPYFSRMSPLIGTSDYGRIRVKTGCGIVQHGRAKLVAEGFTQKLGTGFSNPRTFIPVKRLEMLRILLALPAVKGWVSMPKGCQKGTGSSRKNYR